MATGDRSPDLTGRRGPRTGSLFLLAAVLFALPAGAAAVTYDHPEVGGDAAPADAANLTLVSTQGTATELGAGVYAIDADTGDVVWSYTDCPNKCYDVDPVGDHRVLVVARTASVKPWEIDASTGYVWKALLIDRRNDTVVESFSVPVDTHDVDYLGDGTYLVANKARAGAGENAWLAEAKANGWIDEDRAHHSHLLYVYDARADAITWEYRFREHFPPTAGDGVEADYTHLNDVDLVDDGTAILASAREFDRVLLIDRETKALRWTLGAEDDYDTLHEQHNPSLLSLDPPTVLVADSENDRVVEYRREADGTWERTWVYDRGLRWPRDADRLPNGNTLIVDTGNDRVLEVTPEGEVVWERRVTRNPYDAERVRYGDEPAGPPMHTLRNASAELAVADETSAGVLAATGETYAEYYELARWVLPPGVDPDAFALLHVSGLSLLGWAVRRGRGWRNEGFGR